jgi:uncharacterized protein (DUF1810 family)
MPCDDPHDLARFVDAQAPVIGQVFAELAAGRKRTHWMWFVFPQLRGLGRSAAAAHYGIGSMAEARAYMAHPVLGARLHKAAALVLAAKADSPEAIFGPVDAQKFRSSMSLFALACGDETCQANLDRWYDGQPDPETVRRLQPPPFRS